LHKASTAWTGQPMIPNSDKLSDHLHYFFACYLPQHREVSPHTLSSYKQTFIHLLRYWNRIVPDCPDPALDRFQVGFLLEFLSHLEKELGNTAATRNSRLAALKSFFKMVSLVAPRHQSQCRQILMIPAKRVRRWPFDYLEKNEVDAVFACVNTQTQCDAYRDLCILRLLYNTGARASELCGIGLSDLDLKNKQVLLHGKGKKVRTVPLWDSTSACLETYLRSERRVPLDPYRNVLFINQRRSSLTRSGLYSLCRRYLAEARVKAPALAHKRIHPVHVWRRTTASHLLLAGVDLTVIQEWLGHVSIDTTCKYKGISIEIKREALQKFYLFEKSWPQAKPEGFDWNLHPDLLAFLQSL
jgi:site-specific recombinase XerD